MNSHHKREKALIGNAPSAKGAAQQQQQVVERMEEERKDDQVRGTKDVEIGELAGGGTDINSSEYRTAMLQRLNPTNPLRIVINGSTRVAASAASRSMPTLSPSQSHVSVPRSTPTPQNSVVTLNSRTYSNRFSLILFMVHLAAAMGLVGFLVFKGVQGLLQSSEAVKRKEKMVLKYFLPPVEDASFLSITLAFTWQKAAEFGPSRSISFC